MSNDWTIRVVSTVVNPLLERKQFRLEITNPSRCAIPNTTLREHLAKQFKVCDIDRIVVWNRRVAYGAITSRVAALIYDSAAAAKKLDPEWRLARMGISEREKKTARRAKKDLRNRLKKLRGLAKRKLVPAKK